MSEASSQRVDPRSLSSGDQNTLNKMLAVLGDDIVNGVLAAGVDAVRHRIEAFNKYESSLASHVRTQVPAPQLVVPPKPHATPKPLKVSVKPLQGLQGENPAFWFREVETALAAALVTEEPQKVAFALSHLQGAAREWALTWETNYPGVFDTWESLKRRMESMFLTSECGFPPSSSVSRFGPG